MAKYYKSSKDRWEERTKKLEHAQEGIELLDKIDKELMKAFEILEHDDYGEMPTDSYHGIQGEIKACEEKCEDILNYTRNIHEVAAEKEDYFHKQLSKEIEELRGLDINSYKVKNTLGIQDVQTFTIPNNAGAYGYNIPKNGKVTTSTPKDKITFADIMVKTDLFHLKDQFNEYLKNETVGQDMSEAEIVKLKHDFYTNALTTSFDHEVYTDGWKKDLSEVLDFIPVVGGVKGFIEGCVGYTMTGQKLSTSERWQRGVLGVVTTAVDLVTLGAASKAIEGAKLATRIGTAFGKLAVTNVAAGHGSKFATEAMVNMGFSPEQIMITHVLAGAVTIGASKLKANKLENLAKDAGLRNTKELEDILKYKNLKPKEFESLLKNSSLNDILGLSDDTMKFLTKETGMTKEVIMKELVNSNLSIENVNPNNIDNALNGLKQNVKIKWDAYKHYMDLVEILDISTERNAATFYSGKGNRELAEQFAKLNGKTTLEMTPGGKYLDDLKLFNDGSPLTEEQATNVWKRLSERYANNASGTAFGFTEGARVNSIFNTVEYPTLLKNPDIVNVITELFKKGGVK